MYGLLVVPDKPDADGSLNIGNQVTNDLKVVVKMARLVGVHVSPTVISTASWPTTSARAGPPTSGSTGCPRTWCEAVPGRQVHRRTPPWLPPASVPIYVLGCVVDLAMRWDVR